MRNQHLWVGGWGGREGEEEDGEEEDGEEEREEEEDGEEEENWEEEDNNDDDDDEDYDDYDNDDDEEDMKKVFLCNIWPLPQELYMQQIVASIPHCVCQSVKSLILLPH